MIYLHIPFCKQACSYCNFHFSTQLSGRTALLAAMRQEIHLRQQAFPNTPIRSIYFGGGTPSLLTNTELAGLLEAILLAAQVPYSVPATKLVTPSGQTQVLSADVEITLEANPDDLDEATVEMLAASPVNRLSIGLQSFHEADLRFMNRAHTAQESTTAMERVLKAGFTNLSVDLIYGSPTTTDAAWRDNIQRVLDFGVNHISAYALTVEPKTALAHQVKTGQAPPVDDEQFARQFDILVDQLTQAGFEHYEVSNFARPGFYSQHNTSYWQGKPYLGFGPAAHGFNGFDERRWNISNNAIYTRLIKGLNSAADYQQVSGLYTIERLSKADRYNEFIMTGLRTQWGVELHQLSEQFGADFRQYFETQLAATKKRGYFEVQSLEQGRYRLTAAGRQLADGIAAEAFFI